MLYVPGEGSGTHSDANQAVLEVRYPCREVVLEVLGSEPAAKVTFVFGAEDQRPFGATEKFAKDTAQRKIRKEHEGDPIFGRKGWLDHSGLLGRVDVEVRHGEQLLRTSAPR